MRAFLLVVFLINMFSALDTLSKGNVQVDSSRVLKETISRMYANVDSVQEVLINFHESAILNQDKKSQVQSSIGLSLVYRNQQDYDKALEYSENAFKISEQLGDTLLLIDTNTRHGIMSYVFFQKEMAFKHLRQAADLSKIMYDAKRITDHKMITAYFNLVLCSKRFDEHERALSYLDTCYLIADNAILSKTDKAYLDSERGFLLLQQDNLNESIGFLNKSAEVFEGIDVNKDLKSERGYLAIIYSYLGEAYRRSEQLKESRAYFDRALIVLENNEKHLDQKPYLLKHYAWLLYELDEHDLAFEYLNESLRLSDDYFSAKTLTKSDFINVRDKYREVSAQRLQDLILKNLEIDKKDQEILRFRIFTFLLVLILLIAGLILRIRRNTRIHRQEKEAIQLQQKQAKELMTIKNKELTASTLKLIEKDEIIKQLSEEIKKGKSGGNHALLSSIKSSSASMWEDFNSRFISVNEDFYDKLNAKVPGLSSNDLKICALIKLNFSSKEMAHLLGISNDSVQKARHRLRKKLNLERNVNLTSFISSI